jgi:signal transduction histidine kinase
MTAAGQHAPSSRTLADSGHREWINHRGLKVLSVVLPVAVVLALDYVRFRVSGTGLLSEGHHFFFVIVTIVSITAFALVMFHFIDRAQREVLRRNRELAATNAVSTAVRGKLGVDRIIEVALDSVLASSRATGASVTVFAAAPAPSRADDVTRHRRTSAASPRRGRGSARHGMSEVVEIPLSTGTHIVGQLRLELPAGARDADTLAAPTLQTIGHQLACAIHLAQLVDDLERRNNEGDAFHDVLLQISNQRLPAEILGSVVRHARDLLGCAEATLCLGEEASLTVLLERTASAGGSSVSVAFAPDPSSPVHDCHLVCPVRSVSELTNTLTTPLGGPSGTLGELWIGRRSEVPFTARDRDYLDALCGLATIALTSAQTRENGRQGAILAERERIAREMHDSLAQVLGVTHLRLRALDGREEIKRARAVAVELAELADICEEAYHDVREAILGLRQSTRTERGLLDSMSAYLAKYSDQCGIETTLVSGLEHELALSPRCEVQMIRVIQEALTNVRKHSGARSAVVRISESGSTTTFVVEDDGDGFDTATSHLSLDRFGLFTMRERMGILNGSLTIDSSPGHGTRVIAGVPERSIPRAQFR